MTRKSGLIYVEVFLVPQEEEEDGEERNEDKR